MWYGGMIKAKTLVQAPDAAGRRRPISTYQLKLSPLLRKVPQIPPYLAFYLSFLSSLKLGFWLSLSSHSVLRILVSLARDLSFHEA